MATSIQTWGTSTAMTCTLASLASSATAGRESTAVDLTGLSCEDVIVQVKCKLATGTPGNDKAIYVYLYGSEDGSTYTDNATGSDVAITLTDPTNLVLAQIIPAPASGALSWEGPPFGIAQFFGGVLPRKFGIVVRNYTNVAFDSTEGNHSKKYTPVYRTIA